MRSLLFAGATRPDLVAKLPRSGPDAVVVDLEDAVPTEAKAEARAALPELLASVAGIRAFVRVNSVATAWFEDDVAAARAASATGIVVPKVESAEQLELARDRLGEGPELVAGLESARGVAAAEEILAAAPEAAYFGAEDYIADLGGKRTDAGDEVLYARSKVALAARVAGVAALDQVVVAVRDGAAFERDAERGRAIGYTGKMCIHPDQVGLANRIFGASPEEVERARRLLASWEEGTRRGIAAIEFEGAMVDGPAVRLAREILARAEGQ